MTMSLRLPTQSCRPPLGLCLCLVFLGACQTPEPPAPQATGAPTPVDKAVLAEAPSLEQPSDDRMPAEPVGVHMEDHFDQISQARDAIIRGQPERAQGALIWLAQHNGQLPPRWADYVNAMQQAARAVTDQVTITETAAAVAAIAQRCGDCHKALEAGPTFEVQGFEEPIDPAQAEELPDRMHRHQWAADRMWEGLVTPDARLFKVGAQVLADAAMPKGVDKRWHGPLKEVQQLGAAAAGADNELQRVEHYGRILSRCAGCHQAAGVVPGG